MFQRNACFCIDSFLYDNDLCNIKKNLPFMELAIAIEDLV